MKLQVTSANGIRFTHYTHGRGPRLFLLLHGFPDDAATMLALMELLPAREFTIVAPFSRGIAPTTRSPDRRYHLRDLGEDVIELGRALGFERAVVYGQGWGALAGYAAAAIEPDYIEHLFAAAMPPPSTYTRNLSKQPRQLARNWYVLLFQFPWIGRALLEANDFALLDLLWRQWSPDWRWRESRLAKVKNTFARRRTASRSIRYFRGLLIDAVLDREAWQRSASLMRRPIEPDLTLLVGLEDGCIGPKMWRGWERSLAHPERGELVELPHSGHFPHQEDTGAVLEVIQRRLGLV